MRICGRCTVQRSNHNLLCATVAAARGAQLDSISFLAADLSSTAFNRAGGWDARRQSEVALTAEEIGALDHEIELLIGQYCDKADGFVTETPAKLRRIAGHFRAHLGQADEEAPHCNAPWVSTVIEASGEVRPCFFHAPIGNIRANSLPDILNGAAALQFRANLDIASNPICRRCVCSLHLPRTSG